MYWYRSKTILTYSIAAILLISVGSACKPAVKESRAGLKYFDLKGYFERDSARLTKLNPLILKSVKHNNVTETKRVHISNWGTELSLFKASDINRTAWKNSYSVVADSNLIIYKALEPELITQEILIRLAGGKVKYIMIINDTYDVNNKPKYDLQHLFFVTREKLTYFPDSMYLIQKAQTVRFLGVNKYDIKGLFNQ
jgi:hypothetical protein